jgi:hypothetical protein
MADTEASSPTAEFSDVEASLEETAAAAPEKEIKIQDQEAPGPGQYGYAMRQEALPPDDGDGDDDSAEREGGAGASDAIDDLNNAIMDLQVAQRTARGSPCRLPVMFRCAICRNACDCVSS